MNAIISIVHNLTAILASVTVLAHCVAIFWPRKPLSATVDSEGRPVVWRNETEKKDVACVWWEDPQEELAAKNAVHQPTRGVPANSKLTSFSKALRPLAVETQERRRSVA